MPGFLVVAGVKPLVFQTVYRGAKMRVNLKGSVLLNEKGSVLLYALAAMSIIPVAITAVNKASLAVKSANKSMQSNSVKQGMYMVRDFIIASAKDVDNDGYYELPKEAAGNTVPATLGVGTIDSYGTAYKYCTWDLGAANGVDSSYSQNNVAPPHAGQMGRLISAGSDKTIQTACTDSGSSGDDVVVDIYQANVTNSNGGVSGWSHIEPNVSLLNPLDNVGLGTSTPTHKLELAAGTTPAAGIALGDVEIYRSAANTMALSTGNSLNVVSGTIQIAGGTVIDASKNITAATMAGTTMTLSGGSLSMTNGTSNMMLMGAAGVGAPTTVARSAGTKMVLSPTVGVGSADYAMGVEAAALWQSVNTSASSFKWYAGASNVMTLDGSGHLGIGTAPNPSYSLNAVGAVNASAIYVGGVLLPTVAAGTVAGQTLYWNGTQWTQTSGVTYNSGTGNVNVAAGAIQIAGVSVLDSSRNLVGVNTVGQNLLPSANNTYNLGAVGTQWANIYGNGVYQGGNQVADVFGSTIGYMPKYTGVHTLGNSLIYDNGTGVGIGTTSPARQLTIHGGAANSHILLQTTASGGAINNGFDLVLATTGDAQVWNYQNANLVFGTANNERMRITAGGNTLVGTTTDDGVNKLQVSGSIASSTEIATGGYTKLYGNKQTGFSGDATTMGLSAMMWNPTSSGGETGFMNAKGAGNAGGFKFYQWDGTTATATATLSATGALTMNGKMTSAGLVSTVAIASLVRDVDNSTLQVIGGINGASGTANIMLYGKSHPTAPGRAEIFADNFAVSAATSPYASKFLINSAGNTLIGTTVDDTVGKLQVNGHISTNGSLMVGTSGVTVNPMVIIKGTAGSYYPGIQIWSGYNTVNPTWSFNQQAANGNALNYGEGAFIINEYSTTVAGAITERMRISAGNVIIGGGTDYGSKFQVGGAISAGTANATLGSVILQDMYGANSHITSLGTDYSSGGPMLGYGVTPSNTASKSFFSSAATAGMVRNSMVMTGASISFFTGAAQTVAVGSPVAMSEKMTILNNGNVGINNITPGYTLDIGGSINVTGGFNVNGVPFVGGGIAAGAVTGQSTYWNGASWQPTSLIIKDTVNGRVGVGIVAPAAKHDVNVANNTLANIQTSISTHANVISSTYAAGGNYVPGVAWYDTDNNPMKPKAGMWMYQDSNGSKIQIGTSNSYSVGITNAAITIDPSGYVGIGATAPVAPLEVVTAVNWSAGWSPGITSTSPSYPTFRLRATSGNKVSFVGNNNDGGLWFGVNGTDVSMGQIGMTIASNGNTLVGTIVDNGVDKLQVNGSGHFTSVTATTFVGSLTGNASTSTRSSSSDFSNVIDSRATGTTPQSAVMGVSYDFKINTTEGLSDGGAYFGEMTIRKWGAGTDWSGGGANQLGFTDGGNIWQRSGASATWGAWKKLLDSSNFTAYAPTLTGTGASGTWGISITGNAATATYAN